MSSSRQVRYQIFLVCEGNTLAEEKDWPGLCRDSVEFGRTIRITHRAFARGRELIPPYNCDVQY